MVGKRCSLQGKKHLESNISNGMVHFSKTSFNRETLPLSQNLMQGSFCILILYMNGRFGINCKKNLLET